MAQAEKMNIIIRYIKINNITRMVQIGDMSRLSLPDSGLISSEECRYVDMTTGRHRTDFRTRRDQTGS